MDTQTRHALKQDRLIEATRTSVDWFADHRSKVIQATVAAVLLIAVLVAALVVYNKRSAAADLAFGEAMDTYNAPLAQPGQPVAPGERNFPSAAARAKLANQQFVQLADRYGFFTAGKTAAYFAGLTAMDMGQPGQAETYPEKGFGWPRFSPGVARQTGAGQPLSAAEPQQRSGCPLQPADRQTDQHGAGGRSALAIGVSLREDQSC